MRLCIGVNVGKTSRSAPKKFVDVVVVDDDDDDNNDIADKN